ncbi:MAG: DNA-binding response regulator [Acidocella sp. 20-61-6]|nr:MAG: DNA-binding response regulator [Acidocella sp. 20-61-6]
MGSTALDTEPRDYRVLVIEDDEMVRNFLQNELQAVNFSVTACADGRSGIMLATDQEFDVMVIDRMLPNIDGLGLLSALRAMGIATPVILLTALSKVSQRVEGLRAGADDYLVKPFAIEELVARIHAVIRRNDMPANTTVLRVGPLELDRLSHSATREGVKIHLNAREYRLLEYLMLNAGKVVTRTMLLEAVWDFHFDPQTTLVESHISRIRAKVDRGFGMELIKTVWGAGYRISHEA